MLTLPFEQKHQTLLQVELDTYHYRNSLFLSHQDAADSAVGRSMKQYVDPKGSLFGGLRFCFGKPSFLRACSASRVPQAFELFLLSGITFFLTIMEVDKGLTQKERVIPTLSCALP